MNSKKIAVIIAVAAAIAVTAVAFWSISGGALTRYRIGANQHKHSIAIRHFRAVRCTTKPAR